MDFSTAFRSRHHAVVFPVLDRAPFLSSLRNHLDEEKHIYEVTEANVIDIDTARSLKVWNNKSYGAPKVMVLSFHTITVPAQNALLKVFEEPSADTRFILITSYIDGLLPTVRSRLLEEQVKEENITPTNVKQFLKTNPIDRMKLDAVVDLLEAKDEEDRKDREQLQKFIANLLQALVNEKVSTDITQEVAQFVIYAGDPASSGKSLLEYLSLRLPRIAL
jgi:hypothetical protein